MVDVTIIDEEGNESSQSFTDRDFRIGVGTKTSTGSIDVDTWYIPRITNEVEVENSGQTSSTTDNCGRTKYKRTGDKNYRINIRGYLTDSSFQYDKTDDGVPIRTLSIEEFKRDIMRPSGDIVIESLVHSGIIEVANTIMTDANDFHELDLGRGREKAVTFQMQLGEEEQ